MAEGTEGTSLLLHRLRLRGMLADASLDAAALEADGLATATPAGLLITEAGLARAEEQIAAERAAVDLDAVAAAYERFLAVNRQTKALCARWQQPGLAVEDRFVLLGELQELTERASAGLARTAQQLPRFGSYVTRLEAALETAGLGDGRWINDPTIDSFHTVWMECHEDYLLVLDRSREQEGSF
jgi:hypothetical protein